MRHARQLPDLRASALCAQASALAQAQVAVRPAAAYRLAQLTPRAALGAALALLRAPRMRLVALRLFQAARPVAHPCVAGLAGFLVFRLYQVG